MLLEELHEQLISYISNFLNIENKIDILSKCWNVLKVQRCIHIHCPLV